MGEEDDDDDEEIHKVHCLKFNSSKVSVYTFAVETRLCNMRDLLKERHAVKPILYSGYTVTLKFHIYSSGAQKDFFLKAYIVKGIAIKQWMQFLSIETPEK